MRQKAGVEAEGQGHLVSPVIFLRLCPLLAQVCPVEGNLANISVLSVRPPGSPALTPTSSPDWQDSSAITLTKHEQSWRLARYFLVAPETAVDAQLGGYFSPVTCLLWQGGITKAQD